MNETQEPHPHVSLRQRLLHKRTLVIAAAIILVIVLLVAGIILIRDGIDSSSSRNGASSLNDQQNYKFKAVVSITDTGFVPETITVDKSTQLSFQNDGSTKHSIVADSVTLETEPTLGFKKGETTPVTLPSGNYSGYYNYTFQHSGTFHVHDGYNPTANLTVVVK